jgi:hypothetical protein
MATRRTNVPAPTRIIARDFRWASREKRPSSGRNMGGLCSGDFFRSERTVSPTHAVISNASRICAVTRREPRRILPSNHSPSKYDPAPWRVVYRSYLTAASFAPISSKSPSATWIISSSTVRFRAMASFSGMEMILFERNAAMRPNSPRCTISTAARP